MADVGPDRANEAIHRLLASAHLAAAHELPDLIAVSAALLGGKDAVVYLADLQQITLVPFVGAGGPDSGVAAEPLGIDSTVAGRAFQHVELVTQPGEGGPTRVWLPLINGTDRVGVLGVSVDADLVEALSDELGAWLRQLAAVCAELVVTKAAYSDTIVRLRRSGEMGLAAELQWSLLPPLTFASRAVSIAGALEPAYEVAGDTLDYAVDAGRTRAAIFDGMGHGLGSAQLATIAIAAYRNARRSDLGLISTATAIDAALHEAFSGRTFTTAVLVDLDSDTGVLSWLNAGHPAPLLLRQGRVVKRLEDRPSPPLGLQLPADAAHTTLHVQQERLEPGDHVLLHTDGVTDARSPAGEFFGEQRLADLVTRTLAAELPAAETMRRVVRALLDHQQSQLIDDATMLLLEWCSDQQIMLP